MSVISGQLVHSRGAAVGEKLHAMTNLDEEEDNGNYAMTGGATGIGAELKRQLLERGHQVISVDIKEGDILADLSTAQGRQAAMDGVRSKGPGRPGRIYTLCRPAAGGQATVTDCPGQLFRGGGHRRGPA